MTEIDDIDNNCQTFPDTNDKGGNVLLVEFYHFVNDNLTQCIQDRQNGNVHNNFLVSTEKLVKVKYFSCQN